MFNRSFRLYVIGVLVLLAIFYFLGPASHTTSSDGSSVQQSESDNSNAVTDETAHEGPEWSSTNEMSAHENAEHHWRKHGAEFGVRSPEEYENAARDFVTHPPPGTEEKHEADGDTLYYNRRTNTFAVKRKDGAPRTMFKPDNGESYWDRQ